MQTLAIILFFLSILVFFAAFIGLIKPNIFKEKSRLKAFGKGLLFSIFLFVGFVATAPKNNDKSLAEVSSATPQVNGPTVTAEYETIEKIELESDLLSAKAEQAAKVERAAKAEQAAEAKLARRKAYGYKVVYARDHSIPIKQRKGGLWYIVSDAPTTDERAYTLIQAAKDLFAEMHEPRHAFVWLFRAEGGHKHGVGKVGTAIYVPDGEGKASGFSKNAVWSVEVSDFFPSKQQSIIQEIWLKDREKYIDSEGFLDEGALEAAIRSEVNVSEDELEATLLKMFWFAGKKFDYKGENYQTIGKKMDGSIENPSEFNTDPCMKSIQCWGDKHSVSGGIYCRPFVEKSAKYDFEWTDSWIEAKFSHFRWKNAENRDAGIVTYIGDKVKFQNGYGAWQRVTYECDFDPTGESVLDIRIQ